MGNLLVGVAQIWPCRSFVQEGKHQETVHLVSAVGGTTKKIPTRHGFEAGVGYHEPDVAATSITQRVYRPAVGYAVFWRILPRNYPPPQWDTEGGIMDRSKSNKRNWILVWEEGFCNFPAYSLARTDSEASRASSSFLSTQQSHHGNDSEEPGAISPELFFKMSHEVYNYGEGFMGKVAVDNSHKWVYRDPAENEISFFSPWQGSLEPHPRVLDAQFKSGIQTIVVVAVQEGVLQLGSTQKIMEDLNFVLYMQRKFNLLLTVPGLFVPPQQASTSGDGTRRTIDDYNGNWSVPSGKEFEGSSTAQPNDFQYLSPREAWSFTTAGTKSVPPILEPYAFSNGNLEACLTTCSSPTKAHNTGHTSSHGSTSPTMPPTLIPSMSSLQALLSKLPSVTPVEDPEGATRLHPSYSFPVANFPSNWPPISRQGLGMPPHAHDLSADTSRSQNSSLILESFDNVGDFGIQKAVENGDSSYSSFLNEICS
uniref:Transcription factor MYC/MYB N-terminal domain-containing protein n=2 Tax=Physcomitrium patens TaxID=3218 RepID=A0A7I4FPU3_PHYPA